jgi:general secretion pathway protein D
MKTSFMKKKYLIYLCSLIFLFVCADSSLAKKNGSENNSTDRSVTIDFDNVDIIVFIKFIGELTETNFLIDPKVKGKITIISPKRISAQEAYTVFESVLDVHGYTAIKSGKVTKIIPSIDARMKNIETRLKEESGMPEDKIITQIIPLIYSDPNEIKRLFTPMVSKNSVILAYESTNTLIITDVYSNITRLLKILKTLDVPGMGYQISVVTLEFANPGTLVNSLKSIFQQKTPKGAVIKTIEFVADERTNSVILLANEIDTKRVKALIKLLDKDVPRGEAKINVYYLEHATAQDLAKVLNALPSKGTPSKDGRQVAPIISTTARITPDKATNSLIIMAEPEDYEVIKEVIKKLDIPRSMVYIESLLIEVNINKDFRLGTEWSAMGSTDYGDHQGGIGGGFSGSGDSGYLDLAGLQSGSLPAGFSLGTFSEIITIGGIAFSNLAAIISAFKKDEDVHILSTPQILTTDNEEAKIVAGQNIPYQTQSHAEGSTDTYDSYEYKDVGITLKITPQISEDRLVRLKISQEINKLANPNDSSERPTTLKRTIETTVIVKDGNTVVIGGLIDDSLSTTNYKVPCIGDIPLLGWLFKSSSNTSEKTNLFVFLTPHVLKTPAEASELHQEKQDLIDQIKDGSIKMYDESSENEE